MSNYDWVKTDLETLKKWSSELIDNLPPVGSAISDNLYLQNTAIQIELISQLEYFLKSQNKISRQHELIDVVKNSCSLSDLQKDHLILLFLVRHTLVHNGGHYDNSFIASCNKYLVKLKTYDVKEGLLSSLPAESLPTYVDLVIKLVEENK